MSRLAALALLLLACAWYWPAPVEAQVRQCIGSDGDLVYTDRKCEDIGGRERSASPAAAHIISSREYANRSTLSSKPLRSGDRAGAGRRAIGTIRPPGRRRNRGRPRTRSTSFKATERDGWLTCSASAAAVMP